MKNKKIIELLAIDLGNAQTKIYDGTTSSIEPSVLTFLEETAFNNNTGNNIINFDGRIFYTGKEAISSKKEVARATGMSGESRYFAKRFINLLISSIYKYANPTKIIKEVIVKNLVLGLPNEHFKNIELRNKVIEFYKKMFSINDVLIQIDNIVLIPQPIGAYISSDIESGKALAIIDIGGGTTDVTLIDGNTNIDKMFGINKGVNDISIKLRDYVLNNLNKEELDIEHINNWIVENKGDAKVISEKEYFLDDIMNEINLQVKINNYSLIFVGGGAEMLNNQIKELNLSNIIEIAKPQLANVIGFYEYYKDEIVSGSEDDESKK